MNPPRDVPTGGEYYRDTNIQPLEVLQDWLPPDGFRGFLVGNILKYIKRYPIKGGIDDLRKARYYLDELVKFETKIGGLVANELQHF